jgi:hypothetical protein
VRSQVPGLRSQVSGPRSQVPGPRSGECFGMNIYFLEIVLALRFIFVLGTNNLPIVFGKQVANYSAISPSL